MMEMKYKQYNYQLIKPNPPSPPHTYPNESFTNMFSQAINKET